MRALERGHAVPPVEATLVWVVVLMRLLGWAWLVALVATRWAERPEASRVVFVGALILGTLGTALLWMAVRKGFLGDPWYVVLDGAIAFALLAAGWIAGAGDFVAGGYPMSWLFVVAYATNFRYTFSASLLVTAYFAVLHWVMGLEMVRIVGSIQFVVVAVVAGWSFDSLRERDALRIEAEAERLEAEHELAKQREAAARLQERTEIARELHDSVLQTLKLISSSAEDASEIRYLTRVQERGLRRTINEYRSPHQDSFRARLLDARAAVEDQYRVEIEQVIRDDAEMSTSLVALVAAAHEAMANAARHSGSPTIDLFAEVRADGVQINVRDRGSGFDVDAVGTGGVAHSIIRRLEEVGGTAHIKTVAGRGTDVSLFLPTS